jgi:hypothetical protein
MRRPGQRARGFVCVPTFTAMPLIAGTAKAGQTLTGTDGTIINGAVSARRWLRGGTAISGATGATYLLQAGDIGATITFEVTATATRQPGNSARAVSAPTVAVVA